MNENIAILVGLQFDKSDDEFERSMNELELLTEACDIVPAISVKQKASSPKQSSYVGSGKIEEIKTHINAQDANLVIFNDTLTPMQIRNISKELGIEILDRTGLILQIFSERARTREAKLQVESAKLQYMLPRLIGMWNHFKRQAGTSGSMSNRGVGETQLELDRRQIEHRLTDLRRQLKSVDKERNAQRQKRLNSNIPLISIVGYTNAGKSTLMNHILDMTSQSMSDVSQDKKVFEKDMLFATLDTTTRRIEISNRRTFLLSDTVGFISDLPTTLVKAFRSTLEEACYADLLIEVIDISDSNYQSQIDVTEKTLKDIGAGHIPILRVFNKCDLVLSENINFPRRNGENIYISASKDIGFDVLLDAIEDKLAEVMVDAELLIPFSEGALLNLLNKNAIIYETRYEENGTYLRLKCSKRDYSAVEKYAIVS